nr:hypothetical protein [Halorussus sp. DT72]
MKKLGAAGAALTVSSSVAAADSGRGRTLRPSTSGIEALSEAAVTVTEDANVRVEMSGTKRAGVSAAKGYRVELNDAQTESGRPTPQQAKATVVPLPESELPAQKSDRQTELSSSKTRTDTATEDDGIGTLSHGGGDSESDYEGGVWARTEDPIDITVTKTNHRIEWTTSGGETDWVGRKYDANAYRVESPPAPPSPGKNASIWHVDDSGFYSPDWSGYDVDSEVYADYYNWTWSYDTNKTTSHHRVTAVGNPDGSLDWSTSHWHTGEDATALRVDAGIYGNY